MTVTIAHKHDKHDMPKSESSDSETCCTHHRPEVAHDHTQELLENLATTDEYIQPSHIIQNDISQTEKDFSCEKARMLLNFEDAPEYLKHNTYIVAGYRGMLNTKLCMESVFWWTNETINIWSHLFGLLLFSGLTIYDFILLQVHVAVSDKLIVGAVLVCFQICMALSAVYHTFSCRSEKDFNCFLSLDLFGIALSLLAIYTSGIFYAFWCLPILQNFYLSTVTLIFLAAMVLQIPKLNISPNIKMIVFIAWAAYGVLPTMHWALVMGGLENPVVELLLPRVLGMYALSGLAFAVYILKIPERFYVGKFDYCGHSHNWWHLLVVAALYYWHNTGIMYVEYRMNHACATTFRLQ